MSEVNYTYKKALEVYLSHYNFPSKRNNNNEREKSKINAEVQTNKNLQNYNSQNSFSDLVTEVLVHTNNSNDEDTNNQIIEENILGHSLSSPILGRNPWNELVTKNNSQTINTLNPILLKN